MDVHRRLPPHAVAGLLVPLLALLLAAQTANTAPGLQKQESIERVDATLQRSGWSADGETAIDSLDRELSGNTLASLRSCSGTGVGFCRYQYRRGNQQLNVITVPNSDGDGLVHHWVYGKGDP